MAEIETFKKDSKRITVHDVAEAAGVSVGTVSAVINARSSVREATRRKVIDVMGRLNYELPRSASHRPRSGPARSVAMLVKEVQNPYYADILLGAREVLQEQGLVLFEGTSEGHYRAEGEILESFREHGIGGAIVSPVVVDEGDLSHLFLLHRRGFPLVLLGDVRGLPVSSVTVDNARSAKLAAQHLIEGGHERIVHISGPPYSQHSQDRMTGVREAFSESHLRFGPDNLVTGGAQLADGYRVTKELFSARGPHPTALTCFNDLVAMGALRALAELGLSVPGDVSVVGYDDIEMAEYLSTPLTTVHVPTREMGHRAASLLICHLGDADAAPERIVLDAELIVRASTRSL